jgi:hypothetical protein
MTSNHKRPFHVDLSGSPTEPPAKRAKSDKQTSGASSETASALRGGHGRGHWPCAGCGKAGAWVPVDDDRFVTHPRFVCNQDCFGTLIKKTSDEYEKKKKSKEDACAQCKKAPKTDRTADGKFFCSDGCRTAYLEICPQCGSTDPRRFRTSRGERGVPAWQCSKRGCELRWNICRVHNYKTYAVRKPGEISMSFGGSSEPVQCDCVERGATPTTDERVGFLLLKLKESSARGAKWEEDHLDLLLAHFGQTREQSEKEFRAWLGTA